MDKIVEICCGSYTDAIQAYQGGAKRIELNSSLFLGGLTPGLGALILTKKNTGLKVIAMVRPRGAGFCYGKDDFEEMCVDCRILMEHGADGVAFGILREDRTIDIPRTRQMTELVKGFGGEVVFHRAFDCVDRPFEAAGQLIKLGVDRILTSGLCAKAPDGWQILKELQSRYGDQIEILAGSGVNHGNAAALMEKTGITQVHSSCKDWKKDSTTVGPHVSYQYADQPNESSFETVSRGLVEKLLDSVR